MNITLDSICKKVEAAVPTAKATSVADLDQVIVTFSNRPEVEIALLTPWYQKKVREGTLELADLIDLILSIRRIALSDSKP